MGRSSTLKAFLREPGRRCWRGWFGLAVLLLLAACGERAQPPGTAPTAPGLPQPVAAAGTPPAASAAAAEAVVAPSGDRLAPPVVPAVEREGVRYAQAEDGRAFGHDQVGGVLVATVPATGQRLWTLVVYDNRVHPEKEADVQWVFFKSMSFDADGRLRIVNEAGKTFLVDVRSRAVTPAN